jgi:serine/threonine protein kinase
MNDLIGKTIGARYYVESFLGKGGMAEVYKVWDQERSVHLAMKILHADLAEDKVFLRRFKREAQTLSKLQHPNIVRFYGLEQADDLVYMLMDYVDGTTLRKEIFQSKEPLSLPRILEIMRPVCAALYYAHKAGFVHCDVKPANIMIHKNGSIFLSDFGIARMTEASTVTMVGAGTPAYMSPEQALGETPVPQTDIYALGIILFEMLTGGDRPFTGESAKTTGTTNEKVRWEHMRLPAPPPSKYEPSITPAIDQIVLKCLEKSPSSRYLSAMDLLNDLARQTAPVNTPVQPKPVSKPLPEKPKVDDVPQPTLMAEEAVETELAPVIEKEQLPVIRPENRKNTRSPRAWRIVVIGILCILMVIAGIYLLGSNQLTSVIPLPPNQLASAIPFMAPTQTPKPTETPNAIETQNYDDIFSDVQKFKAEGLITSTNGEYDVLDDYTETFAQRGWLSYNYFDFTTKHFVYKAHVSWSTAGDTNEISGCGIVFGVVGNEYYGVVLDKARIFFSTTRGGHYYDLGKTRGSGRLNFGNPANAIFTLLVFDYKAYVYVDNEFIGEYTLSKDKSLEGNFGYGIISGTNHDYGTRCEITNSRIWKLDN